MAQQVDTNQNLITVTPAAAEVIARIKAEKGFVDHALRVFIQGGGCSGMRYGMGFDDQPMEDDVRIEVDGGVSLLVDPVSLRYIAGATIDFVDSLMGGGFAIRNPNAVSTCGCGSSFRTDEDAGSDPYAAGGCGGGSCCGG